jgi:hypothetical protein
MRIFIVK